MTVGEGTVLGGYRLERRLDNATATAVFVARHPTMDRSDEVTVRSGGGDEGFRAHFLRTAELAARLRHPNLATVVDAGEQDGRLWLASTHVDGVDAGQMAERGGVDAARAVRIVAAAARGLDEVHRAGLRHGDVKPADIRVAERPGATEHVVLTGYGIARAATDPVTFPAPEQTAGGPVDHRADVYALGCTLYQMLTGVAPVRGAPVPPPSQSNPWVPAALDAVVARATAPHPHDRFPDCAALAAAVEATGGASAAPPVRSRRRATVAGLALALVLVIGVAVSIWAVAGGEDRPAPDPAPAAGTRSPELQAALWGSYAYVAEAFPNLLPVSVAGIGHAELTPCTAVDANLQAVSLDVPERIGRVMCLGNGEPIISVVVECAADRTRTSPQQASWVVGGGERWSRPTGSGQLRWGEFRNTAGASVGRLEVFFDDAPRNFCRVQVNGRTSGAELRARWWPGAPL
ncbi:serine/threonine-protein kinase [Nocardia transvalensis]|uniref:non-specific serine/threonine protein kinase n=1 Tax=Nocardia transvalensis TaxID=37333 RepID=A0A7W9PI34_9NOCA|nr:serine/threonine-protein kinase [Nocardia transvalensis]MBB5916582.1 serine/threonine-protein kinase [Nocardia transvalensis]